MGLRQKINKILSRVLILLLSTMVINVLWQIASRFILNNPSSFTDELARYLAIWLGILGAAYVSGQNNHVAINLLLLRLNGSNRKKMQLFINIIIILFCLGALVIGGSRLVYLTAILKQYSPALKVPLAFVYSVLPISGILVIYYKISDLVKPT